MLRIEKKSRQMSEGFPAVIESIYVIAPIFPALSIDYDEQI